MNLSHFKNKVLTLSGDAAIFDRLALEAFRYQYAHNQVYRQWCGLLELSPDVVNRREEIPFLPISAFKTHRVVSGNFLPGAIFESSGTTGQTTSKHEIADLDFYHRSSLLTFEKIFGPIKNVPILALLPSYQERKNSSLIEMVDFFMHTSSHPKNAYYLYNHDDLAEVLSEFAQSNQRAFLFGVTFALLDFCEKHPMKNLQNLTVIETGGMKGRKREMIRTEVHAQLSQALPGATIASEYGMTELLSQGYAPTGNRFSAPPWLKVEIRDPADPFAKLPTGKTGGINVTDLANIHSCCFIETQDLGIAYADGTFEVLGRFDHAEVRGCNLMVAG